MAIDIKYLVTAEGTNKLYSFMSQKGDKIVCKDLADNSTICFNRRNVVQVKDIFVFNSDGSKVMLDKLFDDLSFFYENKDLPTLAQLKSEKLVKTEVGTGTIKEKFAVALEPFETIIPEFDQNKFLPAHQVKILRWFIHLNEILNTIDL